MFANIMMHFIRLFLMNVCVLFCFTKIKGKIKLSKEYKRKIFLVDFVISIVFAMICEILINQIHPFIINILCYILSLFVNVLIIKQFNDKFLIITLMSLGFSLISFSLATILPFILTRLIFAYSIINVHIEYLMIGLIQFLLTYYFFTIRRFKHGFSFLNNKKLINNINTISLFLASAFFIYVIFALGTDKYIGGLIFLIIILGMIVIFYLISHSITKHYKLKMKDRTMEIFNEKLEEKDKEINNLKTELENVLKINHKYNHRISAMEKAVASLSFNTEFAKENEEVIELVNSLSKEYKEELNEISSKNAIQKTGIFGIDNILEYMNNECTKNNIEFKVNLNTNLKELIKNHIKQNELETMLGDHITDSIIAINSNDNGNRKILVEFNKKDEVYEILFYDTGIEFEIDTLLKLGLEKITTHKETRGKRNRIYDHI